MITLVLLPGMDGTGALFAEFMAELGPGYEAVVVSYPPKQALGYAGLEALVRAQLPVGRPFILLAESFSGPIAISLAAARPNGLAGLILCCSFARNPVPLLQPFKALARLLPLSTAMIERYMPLLVGRFGSDSVHAALRTALNRVPAYVLRARLRAVLDVDVTHKLERIRIPVLYLRASEDRLVPPSAQHEISKRIPAAKVIVLHAPHFLLQAIPSTAAMLVKIFIREAVGSSGSAQVVEKRARLPV